MNSRDSIPVSLATVAFVALVVIGTGGAEIMKLRAEIQTLQGRLEARPVVVDTVRVVEPIDREAFSFRCTFTPTEMDQ